MLTVYLHQNYNTPNKKTDSIYLFLKTHILNYSPYRMEKIRYNKSHQFYFAISLLNLLIYRDNCKILAHTKTHVATKVHRKSY